MTNQDDNDPTPRTFPCGARRIKALALTPENHAKFMELKKIAGEQQGFHLNVWQFLCLLMQLWEKHNTDNETSE